MLQEFYISFVEKTEVRRWKKENGFELSHSTCILSEKLDKTMCLFCQKKTVKASGKIQTCLSLTLKTSAQMISPAAELKKNYGTSQD